jgi:hypothetical protein
MSVSRTWSAALIAVLVAAGAQGQQPAYAPGEGPVVLLDANYRNLLSLRLRPSLRDAFTTDGYRVIEREGEISAQSLRDVKIMVSASPVSPQNSLPTDLPPPTEAELAAQVTAAWRLPTPSAYSAAEIEALVDWVNRGGALLVIVDHMPFPGAVQDLTARFGIQLVNGHAVAAKERDRSFPVRFSRSDGSLEDHAITAGPRGRARRTLMTVHAETTFRCNRFHSRSRLSPGAS